MRSLVRVVGFGLLLLAGCGSGGIHPTGTVQLGNAPLSAGQIAFEPVSGSGTTGAGAVEAVLDGKFQVGMKKPLAPGKYLVRITPVMLGSGQDLKTAPPQFKIFETTIELKSGAEPLQFVVPEK